MQRMVGLMRSVEIWTLTGHLAQKFHSLPVALDPAQVGVARAEWTVDPCVEPPQCHIAWPLCNTVLVKQSCRAIVARPVSPEELRSTLRMITELPRCAPPLT